VGSVRRRLRSCGRGASVWVCLCITVRKEADRARNPVSGTTIGVMRGTETTKIIIMDLRQTAVDAIAGPDVGT